MANARGGKRANAGRKSKAEEMGLQRLLEGCFTLADRKEVFTELTRKAKDGDLRAMEVLLAYTYGKPVQRQEVSGPGGSELMIRVLYADADD